MLLRSLNCPNCGGRARLLRGESEAACLHCGSPVKLSQAYLEEQSRGRSYPSRTFLQFGMKATWHGKEFEVVGRQVFGDLADPTSRWEEWVLVTEDGQIAFLEHEEGKWKISEGFTPQRTPSPEELKDAPGGRMLDFGDARAMVVESGGARILDVQGELPWLVSPGQTTGYVDALKGSEFYCVEWTEDAIECYRGRHVDERTILALFNQKAAVAALDRHIYVLRDRRRFGAVCVACAVVSLLFWIYSFGAGSVVQGGTGHTQLAGVGDEGVRFGPLQLTGAGRVHKIEIRGAMTDDSNWVAAVLEDEEEAELVGADGDLWDEHGVDSDGAWHESDLGAGKHFVLNKPGSYFVRMYAEAEPGRTPSVGSVASFTVKENTLPPLYLGLYGFLILILGIGFLLAGSPDARARISQAMESSSDD